MTDRPILFSAPMILALLAGRKTQTRRIIGFEGAGAVLDFVKVATDQQGRAVYEMYGPNRKAMTRPAGKHLVDYHFSPPIAVGDTLWVRESFSGPHRFKPKVNPPHTWPVGTEIWYWADGNPEIGDWCKPKPPMHMPRWMSRITLEVTDVRVERVRILSQSDAIAEGIEPIYDDRSPGETLWKDYTTYTDGTPHAHAVVPFTSAVRSFRSLWESINGDGSWAKNEWVVAYSFTVHHHNIDHDKE